MVMAGVKVERMGAIFVFTNGALALLSLVTISALIGLQFPMI